MIVKLNPLQIIKDKKEKDEKLKEEVKPESNDFQTFLPPDLDDDIEYYEED